MKYYAYVSTRADYDPARTIFVFPPSDCSDTVEKAEQFAQKSGWKEIAELEGGIVIVPVTERGWIAEDEALPSRLFGQVRNDFSSRNGRSLFARGGKLWCWETLIDWIGYEDGADFVGQCAVFAPNHFAAAVMLGGGVSHCSKGENPSDHWFVSRVSEGYDRKNCDIPAALWMLGAGEGKNRLAKDYYSVVNGFDPENGSEIHLGELTALRYASETNAAQQLLLSELPEISGFSLAYTIYKEFLSRIIRWKNGPDGKLALLPRREEFYSGTRWSITSVTVDYLDYPLAVHIPEGLTEKEAAGLPLVFSVHGRGEPAWMFATKNGWDILADETKEFVVVCPDSVGNIWSVERDGSAFEVMIDHLCQRYRLDKTRVYLTGFSNGGAITREVGTRSPHLFAAVAPSNGPIGAGSLILDEPASPTLLTSGYDLPYWVTVGDCDPAASVASANNQIDVLLTVNGCKKIPTDHPLYRFQPDEIRTGDNWYTKEQGYEEGERFTTLVYYDEEGLPKVGLTIMKDMPHGSIAEQSRAAWEFMKHFQRTEGKTVKRID